MKKKNEVKIESLESNRQRLSNVDLFRSLGIICMIMGHIYFGGHFDKFIHAFHMPMFFFVSGFFFKDCLDNPFRHIRKKAKALLIPYICFSFFYILLSTILYGWDFQYLYLLIFNTANNGIPIGGALWFLTSLFLADLFYTLLDYKIRYGWKLHIICLLIAILGNILGKTVPFSFPFGIDSAMVGIGFIHIARTLRKEKIFKKILESNFIISILMMTISGALIFLNGYVNLRTGQYGFIPLFWINSIMIIVASWNICKIIDKYINKWWIYKFIINIGRDSIVYLCLNQISIMVVSKIIKNLIINEWICRFTTLLLVLIILEILRVIITQTKMKLVIGK